MITSRCRGRRSQPLVMSTMTSCTSLSSSLSPKWALDLSPTSSGLYCEEVVGDLEYTLQIHKQATVSTFGTRTSYRRKSTSYDKENNQKVSIQCLNIAKV